MLEEDSAETLEAYRESDSGNAFSEEFSDKVVITSAAADSSLEVGTGNLENCAGVIALTADESHVVGDFKAVCERVCRVHYLSEVVNAVELSAELFRVVESEGSCADGIYELSDIRGVKAFFDKLSLNAVEADFVEFVKRNADGIALVFGKSRAHDDGFKQSAVVYSDTEACESDVVQSLRGSCDKLNLGSP